MARFGYVLVLCVTFGTIGIIQSSNDISTYAPLREYCESNSFKAKCWVNEVIVMQTALYGRMRIGKCVEADLGYLGCKSDVLELADKRCSGRRECEISVPNSEFDKTRPCYKELKVYLEASYNCVKVLSAQQHHCHSAVKIPVSTEGGNVASQTSMETHCGTRKAPWVLEAQAGQRLNLSLVDFGWLSSPKAHPGTCSPQYGYVFDHESKKNTSLCGGGLERNRHISLSKGHSVTVVLFEQPEETIQHFLIEYTAIGCPNLRPPKDAWLKRTGDEAVVGCDETRQTWHLKCNGKQWVGVIGNCTQHLVAARKEAMVAASTFKIPHSIAIFVIVAVALLISCIIIVIGMAFIKKYKNSVCKSKREVKYDGVKTYEDKIKQQQGQLATVSDSPLHHHHRQQSGSRREGGDGQGKYLRKNDYTATQHIWEYPLPDPTSTSNNNMQQQNKEHNTSGSNTTTTGYGGSVNTAHTFASGEDPYSGSRYPASQLSHPSESGRYYVLDQQQMLDSSIDMRMNMN